ncbi:uncharacterized protein [Venturia canescens]|uniref:uncharacterized protein n=1 Tax=Venturia canescens TaxID=32260 RepID=UPI001C9C5D04|nr:uncharacterized protein LOC122416107 [Venturia canescens]
MQSRNHVAILLLVFGIIGVYSYPQSFDTSDQPSSLSTIENPNDEGGVHIYHEGARLKRTPGGSTQSMNKLAKIKEEIQRLRLVPKVPTIQDIIEEAHRAEVREYDALVERLMAQFHISRDAAIQRTLRENQAYVNRVFRFDEF